MNNVIMSKIIEYIKSNIKYYERVDKGNTNNNELDHVHFKDGRALNKDGTWKHNKSGSDSIPNSIQKWLKESGWTLPKD